MSHSLSVSWPDPRLAVLSFADAGRANQLCWAAMDDIARTLQGCRGQGARVLVLASALPGHWLEHAWLRDLDNMVGGVPTTGSPAGWFQAIEELSQPDVITIAAISGDASGGGAELGWACDFRIAEQQVCFRQPEILMNLVPGIGGSSRLARLAGRALAAEMVMLGHAICAERLYQAGAINAVVKTGESGALALAWGRQLLKRPAGSLACLKAVLNHNENLPLDKSLAYEQEQFMKIVGSEHARKGMQVAQAQYDAGASLADVCHQALSGNVQGK